MIKFPMTESPVSCSCGKMAIRRTVPVSYGGKGSRMVSFDSHALTMTDPDFVAALLRLDAFHTRLYELQQGLKMMGEEERKVETAGAVGRFVSFEIETVHPDACHERTHNIPTAIIQSFGLRREIRLEPREQKGQSAKRILSELKTAAEPILKAIKKQKTEGDY